MQTKLSVESKARIATTPIIRTAATITSTATALILPPSTIIYSSIAQHNSRTFVICYVAIVLWIWLSSQGTRVLASPASLFHFLYSSFHVRYECGRTRYHVSSKCKYSGSIQNSRKQNGGGGNDHEFFFTNICDD